SFSFQCGVGLVIKTRQKPQLAIVLLTQRHTKKMTIASTSFILFLFLLSLSLFYVTINGDEQRHNFHTIQLSSLFPSDSCATPSPFSTTGLKNEASLLQVVHKHGPCAQAQKLRAQQHKPSPDEVLRQDQSRVRSIQSKTRNDVSISESTTIPAKDGSTVGSGNYIVTVGLGTPAKQLSLIFDTGSDVTWTQCQPCVRTCYQQQEKIFEPSQSTSYRNVSCDRAVCAALSSATGNTGGCSSSTCVYGIQYGDSSFSVGFFASEKLTLTSTDVFDEFYFGCGENNQGNFGGAAGLIGLGRDKLSLISQTSDKYNNLFSYCLPSTASSTGYLSFGATASTTKSPTIYTPISTGVANFYGLDITAISVGGRKLPVSPSVFSTAKAIIDSGTVITRLPPAAYSALRSAFRQQMSRYPMAPALSLLDTCYDLTKYKSVTVPKIGFFFAGGAELDIQAVGILYASKVSQVCLAFAGNGDASDVAIFGNVQQQTLEVIYDGAGGKIGFASGGCS
ncbi:Aspartyl protease family protein At5g10770, partial [Linum grandiflorum]